MSRDDLSLVESLSARQSGIPDSMLGSNEGKKKEPRRGRHCTHFGVKTQKYCKCLKCEKKRLENKVIAVPLVFNSQRQSFYNGMC